MEEENLEAEVQEDLGDEQLPDDPEQLKALVAELKQKQAEAEGKASAANGNAAKLRHKKKTAEQELAETRARLQAFEEKEKQAKLAELSEAEKLKVLLGEKETAAKSAMTEVQKYRQEANQAKLDVELLSADVLPDKLKFIKPYLAEKMQDDNELSLSEALSEVKKELPNLFKQAQPQQKVVEKPASTGIPAGTKKPDPATPKPDSKVPARSSSHEDRKKFKADVKAKYGVTLR